MSPKAAIKEAFRGGRLYERLAGRSHRHVGYSQFGEDLHVWSYYERLAYSRKVQLEAPLIVDIGAYRPIVHSNSYFFYKKGWHSINIEPTPGTMKAFHKVRPLDTNLEIAIGRSSGTCVFYLFDDKPCVWNTMDKEAALVAQQASGISPKKAEVDVRRLDEVLDRHLGGRSLEILSIDAEGLDTRRYPTISPALTFC